MTTPPSPGTPYHRLGRTDSHRWWRPVVGTLAFLVAYVVLLVPLTTLTMLVAIAGGAPTDLDGLPVLGPVADNALLLATLATALPLVPLTALVIQRRPAGTVTSVTGLVRWRWLGACLLLALVTTVLFVVVETALGGDTGDWGSWPGPLPFLGMAALLVALVPFQAAAEEYVFRGWLLQAVGAYVRSPWPAVTVQALLFGAAHGWGTPWGFGALVVFGSALGWLAVRTGGLEAGVALHLVMNLASFLLLAATDDLGTTETLADVPARTAVLDALFVLGYAAVVARLARRRALDVTVPGASTVDAAAPPGAPGALLPARREA